jgi:hypothetical protein
MGDPGFRYFAAVPISIKDRFGDEYLVGACAVYDTRVNKPLTNSQRFKLNQFAMTIMGHLQSDCSSSFDEDNYEQAEGDEGVMLEEEEETPFTPTRKPRQLQKQPVKQQAPLRPCSPPVLDLLMALDLDLNTTEEDADNSIIYLPTVQRPHPRMAMHYTRRFGKSHPKGIPLVPLYASGNKSPEIRFVAHEMALRFRYGLLILMRITPIMVLEGEKVLVHPSNYKFDILAAFGMVDILSRTPFVPDPLLPVQALQDNFGVRHNGHWDRVDAEGLVGCVLGLVAPVRREKWCVGLDTIKDPTERDRARVEKCVGGVVIAGYYTGIPHPSVFRRDWYDDLCALGEAGQVMLSMLTEFPPGSDYDPAAFGQSLAKKDSYFEGFQLTGDPNFKF